MYRALRGHPIYLLPIYLQSDKLVSTQNPCIFRFPRFGFRLREHPEGRSESEFPDHPQPELHLGLLRSPWGALAGGGALEGGPLPPLLPQSGTRAQRRGARRVLVQGVGGGDGGPRQASPSGGPDLRTLCGRTGPRSAQNQPQLRLDCEYQDFTSLRRKAGFCMN